MYDTEPQRAKGRWTNQLFERKDKVSGTIRTFDESSLLWNVIWRKHDMDPASDLSGVLQHAYKLLFI